MIAFGPVPSRRLGYSLGINNIPPKHCSYSCVYCQVGRTTQLEINRRAFYSIDQILRVVEKKVSESSEKGIVIDYLTLVPDGEPTLDIHLGEVIQGLRSFGIPIAVISNASLIDNEEVQEALSLADWVSVKVDSVIEDDWRRINRPYHRLSLTTILAGILEFRKKFSGELVTETMLISGINDNKAAVQEICTYLEELQPQKSYLSIPTRPPAEPWVKFPDPETLQEIFSLVSNRIPFMDLLFEMEDSDFHSTGDLIDDILSITAVHPIREEALRLMIAQAEAEWKIVDDLVISKRITKIQYRNEWFFVNRLAS